MPLPLLGGLSILGGGGGPTKPGMDWQGNRQLQKMIDTIGKEARPLALKALESEANGIRNASMREVPVDTGYLKNSAYVRVGRNDVLIGYSARYAIYVHESHAAHKAPTKRKYLEDPFKAKLKGMAKRVSRYIEWRMEPKVRRFRKRFL